jgi:hypothetical protein
MDVNPLTFAAALEMGLTLADLGSSPAARDRIIRHATAAGTLAGSEIDPEDEAAAEEAFVEALDAVPGDSDAWDRPDAFLDVESLLEPRRAVGVEPPAEDRTIPADAVLMPPELEEDVLGLPAIAGGAPGPVAEPLPFEPSPVDWAHSHAYVEPLYGYE